MAELTREGNELVLSLTNWERFAALHSSPRVSISKIKSVSAHEKMWRWGIYRGVRAPGSVLPWRIFCGTLRYWGGKDFVAVSGRGPGFVIEFEANEFKRWIVSSELTETGMHLLIS